VLGSLVGSLVEILVDSSVVGIPVPVDSLVKGVLTAGLSAKKYIRKHDIVSK